VSTEIEMKFRLRSVETTVARLRRLGESLGRDDVEDSYYGVGVFQVPRFRVRRGTGGAVVTLKSDDSKVRIPETGLVYDQCEETEFGVTDADAFTLFMESFGSALVRVVSKRRVVFLVDGLRVEVNEVAGAGAFLEIEAPKGARTDTSLSRMSVLCAELELGPADLEERRYVDMLW
jgi:predicted adenylyl cyclase CyaB